MWNSFSHFSAPFQQLQPQFFLAGQIKPVFPRMDVGVLRQRNLHQCLILSLTQDDPDGGVFTFRPDETIEVIDIHLHLTKVLMCEFAQFQVYEYIATQQSVIEDQVDEK